MTTSDRILATLTELAEESRTPEHMGRAYPGIERDVAELMPIHTQLKRLPRDISLSAPAKAALRAQLMANIRQAALQAETAPWWRRAIDSVTAALNPAAFTQAMARPAAMALAITMSVAAGSVTTVSAAMDSVPGDGLYPVKTAYEQVVLAVQLSDENRIKTYYWQAGLRLDEMTKLWRAGRAEQAEALLPQFESIVESARVTAQASPETGGLVSALKQDLDDEVKSQPEGVQLLVKGPAAAPAATVDPVAAPQLQAPQNTAPEAPAAPQQAAALDLDPVSESTTGTGGRIPDTKGIAGEPVGAKPVPTNDPKAPLTPPDANAIPAKTGDSAPPAGPVTAPVATKDQPVTSEPAKPEPITSPAEIPSKVDPPAASQSGGFDPKPQATTDPAGSLDTGKSDGGAISGPGLGAKQ